MFASYTLDAEVTAGLWRRYMYLRGLRSLTETQFYARVHVREFEPFDRGCVFFSLVSRQHFKMPR